MSGTSNNIKVFRVALFFLFTMGWGSAYGQFTIPDTRETPVRMPSVLDSLRRVDISQHDFYAPAKAKADRIARRKERNYFEFTSNLTLTQTQFENWVSGGDNTFSGRATLYIQHKHTRKKLGFDTKINARYGMNYIDKKMFKNEDEFKINQAITWKIHNNWSYSADQELRTQFSAGRKSRTDKTKITTFMAPGFYKVSVGFAFTKSPWTINISPVGGSAVFVLDEDLRVKGMNGVPAGAKAKWQVGPSVRINYKQELFKKVVALRSELYGFTNIKDTPSAFWETTCEIRATKWLTTTVYGKFQYDKTAIDKIQYKYSLGVGLAYTFKSKK